MILDHPVGAWVVHRDPTMVCFNPKSEIRTLKWIAGVDEAGRGPIAGPVVAACVILPVEHGIEGITDSKCLTEPQRERLSIQIREWAVAWGVGLASPAEIDELNILQASLLAMRRAVEATPVSPALLLIDGNRCLPNYPCEQQAVVHGDLISEIIGAASILAKVVRDHVMRDYDRLYPLYGFAHHKGYPTPEHLRKLGEHGVCPIHRRSFAPVAELLGIELIGKKRGQTLLLDNQPKSQNQAEVSGPDPAVICKRA